ncbi:M48 family metalloprotease [Mycobacterium sp. shizuoka-1]|uniref:M48 family metalloprotease n=1 Tax=Mycobacterium sp. shizuoka-1 TaxID=2039281 RepID=UPI00115C1F96|nr:M48 family metalloprotease [Mycobacterium sp. shizuoka-1]
MLWFMLAAPWLVAAVLTLRLPSAEGLFTPEWLTKVLAGTAAVLAITTWTSALAVATIASAARFAPLRITALLVAGWLVWTLFGAVRHGCQAVTNVRAGRLFRNSPHRSGDVLEVDSQIPDAFAVPGRRAVVVVTSALAAALSDDELGAVLRHERAHLAGRHSLLIQAVQVAARLNPLLGPWTAAIRYAAERAADERAAATDRTAALRAVAKAALVCSGSASSAWTGMGGRRAEVMRRVDALQRPGPRPQRRWLLVAATLLVLGMGADLVVVADVAQDRIAPEPGEAAGAVFS